MASLHVLLCATQLNRVFVFRSDTAGSQCVFLCYLATSCQLSTKCICFRKQRTSRLRTSYSCNISINNFHSVRFIRMFTSRWIFSYVAIWHMRVINTNENINVSSHSVRNVRCYRQKGNSINFDMFFLFRSITKWVCECVCLLLSRFVGHMKLSMFAVYLFALRKLI